MQARCDVHPWMTGYVGVVAHPWFAVTSSAGAFTLSGVPPGDYVVEAWHETLGRVTAKVSVPVSGSVVADLAFGGP